MRIEGKFISRHDRTDGRQGGGVVVFALENLAHKVTHLGDSTVAEHSWVIVHSDHGPYMIGCWYRPPAPGEIESIRSLKEEVQTHASRAVESVVLGDLNVHHRRWLKVSNRNSWEGEELCSICKEVDLTQLIREPTRGEYLFDVVFSSVLVMKTEVLPPIADHKPVMATFKLSVPSHVVAGRKVWRYRQADCERPRDMLDDTYWDHLTKWVTDTVLRVSIPLTTLRARTHNHTTTHPNCSVSHSTASSGWTCACGRR